VFRNSPPPWTAYFNPNKTPCNTRWSTGKWNKSWCTERGPHGRSGRTTLWSLLTIRWPGSLCWLAAPWARAAMFFPEPPKAWLILLVQRVMALFAFFSSPLPSPSSSFHPLNLFTLFLSFFLFKRAELDQGITQGRFSCRLSWNLINLSALSFYCFFFKKNFNYCVQKQAGLPRRSSKTQGKRYFDQGRFTKAGTRRGMFLFVLANLDKQAHQPKQIRLLNLTRMLQMLLTRVCSLPFKLWTINEQT